VNGVMSDVWWGIVEAKGPKQYNWNAYVQMAQLAKQAGISLQVVMSFHECGGNVGDQCNIPLPPWVLAVGNSNPNIFYRDQQGGIDLEYLSLGVDNQSIFSGRSAVQIYTDFMNSFRTNLGSYMPSTIDQVQVGLGPAGEMRYPSYQLQGNKWTYCGIGEFQCYDTYMLANLKAAATNAGNPSWGNGGPSNAGTYNSVPSNSPFFSNGFDNYQSSYGQFFLSWYAQQLIGHGDQILAAATAIFRPIQVTVAAKISGIHWWYVSPSHAAECTAGYYNTNGNNAYLQIARMFARHHVEFDFTCLEMVDSSNCASGPQQLVKQAIQASQQAGIAFSGENALPICDPNCYQSGFDQVYSEATQYGAIARFTYLRLDSNLLSGNNWNMFTAFVRRMAAA